MTSLPFFSDYLTSLELFFIGGLILVSSIIITSKSIYYWFNKKDKWMRSNGSK